MLFHHQGIVAWVADSEGKVLPEYDVKLLGEDRMECWIPSEEGTSFKIMWRVLSYNPQYSPELAVYPFLDGVPMAGTAWNSTNLLYGIVGELGTHVTGPSSARLYEFGKRVLTDSEDVPKLSNSQLNYLNTIAIKFVWGFRGAARPPEYQTPEEITQINEKLVKNGHSGSAGLGKTIARAHVPTYTQEFFPLVGVWPIKFIFRYAPREWLQAREIVPYPPRPGPDPQVKLKRERSFGSDVIDIDDLHTDNEGTPAPAAKQPIPPSVVSRKRQRTIKREEANVKIEE